MIDARGKGRFGGDKQAELARFLDGAHAAHQLGVVAVLAGQYWVIRGINPCLPQRRIDVARRDTVDAHVVGGFVDGQGLGERRDGPLGGHIGSGIGLGDGAHQARHIDDIALDLA